MACFNNQRKSSRLYVCVNRPLLGLRVNTVTVLFLLCCSHVREDVIHPLITASSRSKQDLGEVVSNICTSKQSRACTAPNNTTHLQKAFVPQATPGHDGSLSNECQCMKGGKQRPLNYMLVKIYLLGEKINKGDWF